MSNPTALSIVLLGILAMPAHADEIEARIQLFTYRPSELAVAVGDTIRWHNQDGIEHSVTADKTSGNMPVFATGLFTKGETRTIVLETAGTYAFHCLRHPSMTGTISVTD